MPDSTKRYAIQYQSGLYYDGKLTSGSLGAASLQDAYLFTTASRALDLFVTSFRCANLASSSVVDNIYGLKLLEVTTVRAITATAI
jgi:hypothetical protein